MKRKNLLAIASSGGHWMQLMAIAAAFEDFDTIYVTTMDGLANHSRLRVNTVIHDCNRNDKWSSLLCALAIVRLYVRFRPAVVVTTGALPGLVAIVIGKVFRARTVWIDSIANAEEMSLSGRTAKRFADLWISQWEHVAKSVGASYLGRVF